jgi:hypothetical protein
MLTALDHTIEINFGAAGIGGSATSTTWDGYYELDININGSISKLYFYRLLGDVDGDQVVTDTDINLIAAAVGMANPNVNLDVNGDSLVNTTDKTLATSSKGRKLTSGLHLDG